MTSPMTGKNSYSYPLLTLPQDYHDNTNCSLHFHTRSSDCRRKFSIVPSTRKFNMPLPHDDPRIRILKTAFVVHHHVDIQKAKQFYQDFGLSIKQEHKNGKEIFFQGYGTEPFIYVARESTDGKNCFGGATYQVESRTELERATSTVPGARNTFLLDCPGGGEAVTLTDPVGHKVHLVWGQEEKIAEPPHLEKIVVNYEDEKPRKGQFQRFQPGPAPVHRWGHYGVTYPEGQYQRMFDWYTGYLSLAVSDVVYRGDAPVTCFFHIDRHSEFTDHHAFFFKLVKPGKELHVAHCAFEVHDYDIQQLGHDHLTSKGYKLCWGIGRVCDAGSAHLISLTSSSMFWAVKCLIIGLIQVNSLW